MTLIQESDGNKEEIIGLRERESGYGGQNKLVLRQVLEKDLSFSYRVLSAVT